jgi:hypothetical protein
MKQQQLEHAQVDFDKAAEIYTGLIKDGWTNPNTGKDFRAVVRSDHLRAGTTFGNHHLV